MKHKTFDKIVEVLNYGKSKAIGYKETYEKREECQIIDIWYEYNKNTKGLRLHFHYFVENTKLYFSIEVVGEHEIYSKSIDIKEFDNEKLDKIFSDFGYIFDNTEVTKSEKNNTGVLLHTLNKNPYLYVFKDFVKDKTKSLILSSDERQGLVFDFKNKKVTIKLSKEKTYTLINKANYVNMKYVKKLIELFIENK